MNSQLSCAMDYILLIRIQFVEFLVAVIFVFLRQVVLVEVKGRKFLMLLGLGGMGIFYSVVTVAFYYAEKVCITA